MALVTAIEHAAQKKNHGALVFMANESCRDYEAEGSEVAAVIKLLRHSMLSGNTPSVLSNLEMFETLME